MERLVTGIAGIALILLAAVLLSTDRRAIRLRVVGPAFALQAGIAALVLYLPAGRAMLAALAAAVNGLLGYARAGSAFVLGDLAADRLGQNFAFQALPPIIFFAALIAVLYYLGVMQAVVRWIGGGLGGLIGISRAEGLCAAANIFVGQSESPLVVRPYLPVLTASQMFLVMTVGMAGVAGTILAAYAAMGVPVDSLLAASFMAAPGGILMAKLVMPDPPGAPPLPAVDLDGAPQGEERPANVIMAAAQGAQTGLRLAAAVGAMVLAFVALVALANGLLGGVGELLGIEGLSLERLLGYVFAPVARVIGIPAPEALVAGGLLGQKLVLNEFVAFLALGKEAPGLAPRSVAILTIALCGFANFGSIAIQLAVTGGLAPSQRPVIARLGLRALAAATLANLMSAALAGLMLP